jgi:aminopeptidase YwaD
MERLVGEVRPAPAPQGDGRLIFRRNEKLKGPMGAFGYDYFSDHYGVERESTLRLMRFQGLRGSGGEYAYEVLNLVNGRRTAQEMRDFVSATYGPVPLDIVVEYLHALESIKVIEAVK